MLLKKVPYFAFIFICSYPKKYIIPIYILLQVIIYIGIETYASSLFHLYNKKNVYKHKVSTKRHIT